MGYIIQGRLAACPCSHTATARNPIIICNNVCVYFLVGSKNCEERLLASSCCLSVRPHGTTRLPLDGFSLNLIFEYFS
jgi:hypothetical protein